jgi:hypothetical protein
MLCSFILAVVLAVSASAQGPQPVDALKTCLADNTSGKDRKDLARWIFVGMAAHPEIRQYASANVATATDESSRAMAALVTRLLTDSCLSETRAAMKTGQGSQALQLAFAGLGQLAMQELMADKSVQESMGAFMSHIDQARLTQAITGK